jgi:hypothetical protein
MGKTIKCLGPAVVYACKEVRHQWLYSNISKHITQTLETSDVVFQVAKVLH